MTSPRPGQRDKPSTWSRARRDRATPQFSSLALAIFLCAIVSVILEVVGGRLINLPKSIVYSVIVIADLAILAVAGSKISAINKRAAEARREVYRQKFERDLEAIRAWSERRNHEKMKDENNRRDAEEKGENIRS